VVVLVDMAINSVKPKPLNVTNYNKAIKGSLFIRTNQALIAQMLDNWMPNDVFWPTVLLDNMPNFQLGELEVVRYNVRVLRDRRPLTPFPTTPSNGGFLLQRASGKRPMITWKGITGTSKKANHPFTRGQTI